MEKGQIVYLKPGINTGRYNKTIREGKIVSVGRKYITVELESFTYQFYKDTLEQKTDYAEDYYLYIDKQQILDEEETQTLTWKIQKCFGSLSPKLPLDKLRRINEILEEE